MANIFKVTDTIPLTKAATMLKNYIKLLKEKKIHRRAIRKIATTKVNPELMTPCIFIHLLHNLSKFTKTNGKYILLRSNNILH